MSKLGMSSPVTKIFLTGFMGVGKTTVGNLLARKRGVPFIDTDHWIEAKAGKVQRKRRAVDVERRLGEEQRESELQQGTCWNTVQHQNSAYNPPRHRPGPYGMVASRERRPSKRAIAIRPPRRTPTNRACRFS